MTEANKIKIKDFVQEYTTAVNDASRKKICEKAISRTYIPILEKFAALSVGIDKSTQKGDKGIFINSVLGYVLYVMTTISLYVGFDLEDLNTVDAYDLLRENRCLDDLLLCIPEKELEEMERVYNLMLTDRQTNELSTLAFMTRQVNRIERLIAETLSKYEAMKEGSSDISEKATESTETEEAI